MRVHQLPPPMKYWEYWGLQVVCWIRLAGVGPLQSAESGPDTVGFHPPRPGEDFGTANGEKSCLGG
jgi:hypothetical protein